MRQPAAVLEGLLQQSGVLYLIFRTYSKSHTLTAGSCSRPAFIVACRKSIVRLTACKEGLKNYSPMVLWLVVEPFPEGFFTVLSPQKSFVVPQNPNLLQQTFRGHFSFDDHCEPQPGSHSDFWSQEDVQLPAPQKVGPRPQTPPLLQQPSLHGLEGELGKD